MQLNDTLGAAYIGNIVSSILYGITSMQAYTYFSRNEGDRMLLRFLIFSLWILDTLHLAFVSHAVYTYTVTDFANWAAVLELPWSIVAQIIVTALSDLLVRCIFCHRVWKCETLYNAAPLSVWARCTFLSVNLHMWVVFFIICASTLVAFGGSLAFAVDAFGLATFSQISTISWILYTSFISGVVADISIAASLCFLLSKHRTGFARTDSMVRILMIYSINTGALTSIGAIICLVTYATMPSNFIFIAFYFVLPKLFFNSLLATLNARRTLRETSTSLVSIPFSKTASFGNINFRRGVSGIHEEHGVEIQIHTATHTNSDSMPQTPQDDEPWNVACSRMSGTYGIAV